MKTVETKTARLHKLAITVDLKEEEQIKAAINLLVEKLGTVPILINEEQASYWEIKKEKPYYFCFIKAYCTVVGCGISKGKKAIDETKNFQDLRLHPVALQRFWEVFHTKLKERL
tara:strand:+ start:67 stop:411 length:345 start_codon:yes stop_codon:yes gene_type:complete